MAAAWYRIYTRTLDTNTWILYREDDDGRSVIFDPRERYALVRCPRCKRLSDEYNAIATFGLDDDVVVETTDDFVETNDGFLLVSSRVRDFFVDMSVRGSEFIVLPDDRYYLVKPSDRVSVEWSKATFSFDSPCRECGRPMSSAGLIRTEFLTLPTCERQLIATEYRQETMWARRELFLVSRDLVVLCRRERFTGVEHYGPLR